MEAGLSGHVPGMALLTGVALMGLSVATGAQSDGDDRQRLLGVWRLVSVEATAGGTVSMPLGAAPSGLLVLDASGHWSAQLMGEGHASAKGDPRVTYRAHFGTFTIDSAKKLLTLRRNGDLDASGIGSDTLRYYTFEGRRIVFRLPAEQRQGVEVVTRVTWERVD